jgi:hypothetical protein
MRLARSGSPASGEIGRKDHQYSYGYSQQNTRVPQGTVSGHAQVLA